MIAFFMTLLFLFVVWVLPALLADVSHVHEPYHFSEYEASSLGESAMFLNMYNNE